MPTWKPLIWHLNFDEWLNRILITIEKVDSTKFPLEPAQFIEGLTWTSSPVHLSRTTDPKSDKKVKARWICSDGVKKSLESTVGWS